MPQLTAQTITDAAAKFTAARTAHAEAVEHEIEQKFRLSLKENEALSTGVEGSNETARKANLLKMFEDERAHVRMAEKATRAARLALDNAETEFTAVRYQVRLQEAGALTPF